MVSAPNSLSIFGFGNRAPSEELYHSTFLANGPSVRPTTNGARVMLSTPPDMITSASPQVMACAAVTIEFMPEPHRRLSVDPGTSIGNPARSRAWRATFRCATASASALRSVPSTCASGRRRAASTARLPLPVHRSSTRRVRSFNQASMLPSANGSAISDRGMMQRASTVNGTPCNQASPVR